MIIMAYVCLTLLLAVTSLATVSLAVDDKNATGTLGGAFMTLLVVLALIGVIGR